MKYTPIKDQVLVELDPFEGVSEGGIVIPPEAYSKPMWGTVRAAGPGRYTKKGKLIPTELEPGDRVCVPWSTGNDMTIGGRMHVSIHEADILAIGE